MKDLQELKDYLDKMANEFADHEHPALILADKSGSTEAMTAVASALVSCAQTLQGAVRSVGVLTDDLEKNKKSAGLTFEKLDEMAALADAFDESGDPLLVRQASVIDEILLTIGANKAAVTQAKQAQDFELEKLRAKQPAPEDVYSKAKKEHDRDNKVEESKKLIADAVKDYRPLEAGLSTRTCPDHPGSQMARIADQTWQCSLDKGIYNYQSGFKTMRGNVVPGGDVSNQTQSLHDSPSETSFDTRESKLNPM